MHRLDPHRAGPPVVVTATNRLARRLTADRAAEKEAEGILAWERPSVLPWQPWLRELFDQLLISGGEDRCRLSPAAEALLWETVVAESELPLIHARGAARLTQEAWQLLCDWGLSAGALDEWGTEEGRWMQAWIADFLTRCDRLGVLDGPRLAAVLARAFEAGALQVPERLTLAGFDELAPTQRGLVAVLERLGAQVELSEDPLPAGPSSCVRVALADGQAEIRLAVAWAVARVAQAPDRKVAIVVPRLAEHRSAILARLEDLLEPARLLSAQRPRRALYNLSLGAPLGDMPLVHDALAWWRLATGAPQPLESLSGLLRSPFSGGAEDESEARALLDLEIRRRARPEMTLGAWVALCRRCSQAMSRPAQGWLRLLARFAARAERLGGDRRAAGEWRGSLKDLLGALGWPGQRGLDSHEHQQLEALGAVLDSLSGLDAVRREGLSYAQLLVQLERSLGDALFQPESATVAPIQVMGPLEAAGQSFDGIWVLELDEAHWPAPAHPNPFLPYALQRQLGMPHASPDRELDYARRLTERLLASGREVVVSHPLREGDAECTPSPLISALPRLDPAELGLDLAAEQSLAARLAIGTLERFDDEQGPPLATPVTPRGGSAVLADQSACPFRAFARHRLGADGPEAVEPGLDAATFGSLVHRILEVTWGELEGLRRLAALAAEDLSELVSRAVDSVLSVWQQRLPDVLTPGLSALLRERLIALVGEWLEIEKHRTPFKVLAREQEEHIDLGGLALRLKVDRIDELEDGSRIILDYKTGTSASVRSWDQDRLEEPQLPLYAVAVPEGLGGLALAKVRRDKHRGFEGVVVTQGVLPGRSLSLVEGGRAGMAGRVERWRSQLESLARELTDGEARVDPLPGACEYCGLDLLCRRWELKQAAGALGEDLA